MRMKIGLAASGANRVAGAVRSRGIVHLVMAGQIKPTPVQLAAGQPRAGYENPEAAKRADFGAVISGYRRWRETAAGVSVYGDKCAGGAVAARAR